MALIDRYMRAVRARLPRKDREDITAELRDILQSQIEAEEAQRGRPLAEEEVAAILKKYGSPERVAAGYGAREHLIGPAVFSHYVVTVKVVLWILVPPLMLWAAATALTYNFTSLAYTFFVLDLGQSVRLFRRLAVTLAGATS